VPGTTPTERDQAATLVAKLTERFLLCRMQAPSATGTPSGDHTSDEEAAAAVAAAAGAGAGRGETQRGSPSGSDDAAAPTSPGRRASSPDPSGKRFCFGLPAPGTPLEYEAMPWSCGRGSWADVQEEVEEADMGEAGAEVGSPENVASPALDSEAGH
jgi:hypothetical protein